MSAQMEAAGGNGSSGSIVPVERLTSHEEDHYEEEDYEDYEDMEFHEPPEPAESVVQQHHEKPSSIPSTVPRSGQGGTTRPLILRIVKEVTESEDGDESSVKQEVVLKPVVPEFETILEYECAEELEEGPSEEEARKEASRISQELLNGLVVYYVRPGGGSGSAGQDAGTPISTRGATQAGTAIPGPPVGTETSEAEVMIGQEGTEAGTPMSLVRAQPIQDVEQEGYEKKAKYVCHLCKMHFTTGAEHRYHMRSFHNATAARPCPICSKPFYNTTDLRNHVMAHKGVKPYKCQICGHAFTVKSNLTNHQLRHGPLEYECQICGKRLAQPASLKKHLKSHAGNKPFQCSLCDKRFLQRGDLTRHQLVHNGQRDFTCDLCEKQFSLKANLQTHRRKVHGQDSMIIMQ